MLTGLDFESWHQHLQLDQDRSCCLQHIDIEVIIMSVTAMLTRIVSLSAFAEQVLPFKFQVP